MFKVNNKDTRTTPGVVLVSLLLTLNVFLTSCSSNNALSLHVMNNYALRDTSPIIRSDGGRSTLET